MNIYELSYKQDLQKIALDYSINKSTNEILLNTIKNCTQLKESEEKFVNKGYKMPEDKDIIIIHYKINTIENKVIYPARGIKCNHLDFYHFVDYFKHVTVTK